MYRNDSIYIITNSIIIYQLKSQSGILALEPIKELYLIHSLNFGLSPSLRKYSVLTC